MSISTREMLKYPTRETAVAYAPENGIPFEVAVIGTTYPIENYSVSGIVPSSRLRIDHILGGEGEYLVDGQWIAAKAGDTFLLKPHSTYSTRGSVHKLWISFEAAYSAVFLDTCKVSSGVYHLPQLRRTFDAIAQLTHDNPASSYVHFEIAENVHKIIHRIAYSMESRDTDCAMTARSLLNSMIYQKANLTEVANAMHMSKANVIRLFKKRFGVTPHQYVLEQKIEAAKLLLQETGLTVKDISQRLGIADEHYFSVLFKKYTGLSPREYRRTHGIDESRFSCYNNQKEERKGDAR